MIYYNTITSLIAAAGLPAPRDGEPNETAYPKVIVALEVLLAAQKVISAAKSLMSEEDALMAVTHYTCLHILAAAIMDYDGITPDGAKCPHGIVWYSPDEFCDICLRESTRGK